MKSLRLAKKESLEYAEEVNGHKMGRFVQRVAGYYDSECRYCGATITICPTNGDVLDRDVWGEAIMENRGCGAA